LAGSKESVTDRRRSACSRTFSRWLCIESSVGKTHTAATKVHKQKLKEIVCATCACSCSETPALQKCRRGSLIPQNCKNEKTFRPHAKGRKGAKKTSATRQCFAALRLLREKYFLLQSNTLAYRVHFCGPTNMFRQNCQSPECPHSRVSAFLPANSTTLSRSDQWHDS
jgi:hypothetical protein